MLAAALVGSGVGAGLDSGVGSGAASDVGAGAASDVGAGADSEVGAGADEDSAGDDSAGAEALALGAALEEAFPAAEESIFALSEEKSAQSERHARLSYCSEERAGMAYPLWTVGKTLLHCEVSKWFSVLPPQLPAAGMFKALQLSK